MREAASKTLAAKIARYRQYPDALASGVLKGFTGYARNSSAVLTNS